MELQKIAEPGKELDLASLPIEIRRLGERKIPVVPLPFPEQSQGVSTSMAQVKAVMDPAGRLVFEHESNWTQALMAEYKKRRIDLDEMTKYLRWFRKGYPDTEAIEEDITLAAEMGMKLFRISGIDPQFVLDPATREPNEAGIQAITNIFRIAQNHGVQIVFGFLHRETPHSWDWTKPETLSYWNAVAETILTRLKDQGIQPAYLSSITEPLNEIVALGMGKLEPHLPPLLSFIKPAERAKLVAARKNMEQFHRDLIVLNRKLYQEQAEPVIVFHGWMPPENEEATVFDRAAKGFYQDVFNGGIRSFLAGGDTMLGIYTGGMPYVGFSPFRWRDLPWNLRHRQNPRPEATRIALAQAAAAFPNVPLVAELGIGEEEQQEHTIQVPYLLQSLAHVAAGLAKKEFPQPMANFYWTLVPNWEWFDAMKVRYGLADVDDMGHPSPTIATDVIAAITKLQGIPLDWLANKEGYKQAPELLKQLAEEDRLSTPLDIPQRPVLR
ncbi:family 1 glycosylhydrolase [Candidatus Gottesmanbacteria bacterium]|nr:family 1 glycosylhydrolase [Candidatus Gottesmanbacteria bacterium]